MQEKHEVIKERLRFVRERMKAENVDIFCSILPMIIICLSIRAHIFADREYLSGFYRLCGNIGSDTDRSSTFLRTADIFVQAQAQL